MRWWTRRRWLRTVAAAPLGASVLGVRGVRAQLAAWRLRRGHAAGGYSIAAGRRRERHHDARARGGIRDAGPPGLLLVHGFPELGYSWRKVMLPLAKAGYHVIAPDQRGYGRSGGTDVKFDDDLSPFSTLNRVRDMLALIYALGHRSRGRRRRSRLRIAGRGLVRADAARRVSLGRDDERAVRRRARPAVQHRQRAAEAARRPARMDDELAALSPPRKHYQTYYTTREANENMWHRAAGLHDFLRAYYHVKSADWTANKPFPLAANSAGELAKLPRYYVMDLDKGMAEQVAADMPTARADRGLPVAHRRRAQGLQLRVRPHRLPGRAAVVPRRPRAPTVRGAAALRRPHHRRAVAVPLRQERLGRLPTRRQLRGHAASLHEDSAASSSSTAPGTGCSRNSRRRSLN